MFHGSACVKIHVAFHIVTPPTFGEQWIRLVLNAHLNSLKLVFRTLQWGRQSQMVDSPHTMYLQPHPTPFSHLSPPTHMPCSHLKGPGLCGLVLTSLATYSSVYREHHNYSVGVLIHIEKFQLYSSHIKHSHSKHSAF